MPGVVDYIASKFMDIATIRGEAANHNGQCTWAFSQGLDPVRSLIGKSKKTADGICEILSAKWVCEAAKNQSLSAWLTGPAGLDLAKLSLLAQIFGTGTENKQQEQNTESWMRRNGLPPRNNGLVDMGGPRKPARSSTPRGTSSATSGCG